MKSVTRAAATVLAAVVATTVIAVSAHAGAGARDSAVWCAKAGQTTNGTCPVQPPVLV